jgi:hypothetical protein
MRWPSIRRGRAAAAAEGDGRRAVAAVTLRCGESSARARPLLATGYRRVSVGLRLERWMGRLVRKVGRRRSRAAEDGREETTDDGGEVEDGLTKSISD